MKSIYYKAINYKPNIRILENYIITFEIDQICLYNFSGDELDKIKLLFYIDDICVVNNIFFIAFLFDKIYGIKINNEQMESEKLLDNQDVIKNTIYLKNNRLLVVSYSDKIILYDIENIKGRPIQIIYTNLYIIFVILIKIFLFLILMKICNYIKLLMDKNIINY